jgi:hypothetical protein
LYAAGAADTLGGSAFTVLSLSAPGMERWTYCCGPPFGRALSILQGPGDHLYAAGICSDTGFTIDFAIVSLTTLGTERWVYRCRPPGTVSGTGAAVAAGIDGNLYASGTTFDTASIAFRLTAASVTADGVERWTYRYSGGGLFLFETVPVCCSPDGMVYLAGTFFDTLGSNTVVVGLSPTGVERWAYRVDSLRRSNELTSALAVDDSCNVYWSGVSTDSAGRSELVVASLTAAGTERWVYRHAGPVGVWNGPVALAYGADRRLYAVGTSFGAQSGLDLTLVCLRTDGSAEWVFRCDTATGSIESGTAVAYGGDGNVYAAGAHGDSTWSVLVISVDPALGLAESGPPSRVARARTQTVVRSIAQMGLSEPVQLLGADGRSVAELLPGAQAVRRLAPGVYYLKQKDGEAVTKVVVVR